MLPVVDHRYIYSRPSIIRTLSYPSYQVNDIHIICGVHQIELTYPPIENMQGFIKKIAEQFQHQRGTVKNNVNPL